MDEKTITQTIVHEDLIDRSEVMRRIDVERERQKEIGSRLKMIDVFKILQTVPSLGNTWEAVWTPRTGMLVPVCSNCGAERPFSPYGNRYCSVCGRKMKGEDHADRG